MTKQGNFFIRLCYGYVGRYKDTSKMTTKEVIEEFLKRKGVSSQREFFGKVFVKNQIQHKHLDKWTEPPSFGEQMSNYLGIDKFTATKITDAIISWSDGVYKQIRKAQQENNVTNPFYQKAKYLEEYIELAPKWKGKPIYREEGEILVSGKAEYKVVNKYTKGKRTYIEVEEI